MSEKSPKSERLIGASKKAAELGALAVLMVTFIPAKWAHRRFICHDFSPLIKQGTPQSIKDRTDKISNRPQWQLLRRIGEVGARPGESYAPWFIYDLPETSQDLVAATRSTDTVGRASGWPYNI